MAKLDGALELVPQRPAFLATHRQRIFDLDDARLAEIARLERAKHVCVRAVLREVEPQRLLFQFGHDLPRMLVLAAQQLERIRDVLDVHRFDDSDRQALSVVKLGTVNPVRDRKDAPDVPLPAVYRPFDRWQDGTLAIFRDLHDDRCGEPVLVWSAQYRIARQKSQCLVHVFERSQNDSRLMKPERRSDEISDTLSLYLAITTLLLLSKQSAHEIVARRAEEIGRLLRAALFECILIETSRMRPELVLAQNVHVHATMLTPRADEGRLAVSDVATRYTAASSCSARFAIKR